MNAIRTPQTTRVGKKEWGSILQLILGILAFGGFSILAVFSFATGIINQLNQGDLSGETTSSLAMAWSYTLMSGLIVIMIFSVIFHMIGLEQPTWVSQFLRTMEKITPYLILLWPVVLLVGAWISSNANIRWIFLPFLHLLSICIPIIWLIYIGRHGLNSGSFKRSISTLCVGMVGSFALSLIAETLLIVLIVIVGIVILSNNSMAIFEMNLLAQRISNSQMDSEALIQTLRPYLTNPIIIFGVLALLSGFIPLIEEAFKPLAVWLLGKKLLTPAEGFATGLLAGGGFALIESLGRVGSTTPSDWLTVEIGRGGTDLLHILTAGMMGWALVSAWQNRKMWLPVLTYLGAIVAHGLWNGLILGLGLVPFFSFSPSDLPVSHQLTIYTSVGLGVLFVVMMITLLRVNYLLQVKHFERTNNAGYL